MDLKEQTQILLARAHFITEICFAEGLWNYYKDLTARADYIYHWMKANKEQLAQGGGPVEKKVFEAFQIEMLAGDSDGETVVSDDDDGASATGAASAAAGSARGSQRSKASTAGQGSRASATSAAPSALSLIHI